MHSKGVAHRDLKLENILVGERGVEVGDIIIADLGLSRILSKPEDGEHGMTYMCGSSGYVAPEVIRSATDASGRALFTSKPTAGYGLKVDVWSVGVILHTLVYGSRPYEGAPADMVRILLPHNNNTELRCSCLICALLACILLIPLPLSLSLVQVRYLVSDKAADDAAAKIPQGILDPEGGGIGFGRRPALRCVIFCAVCCRRSRMRASLPAKRSCTRGSQSSARSSTPPSLLLPPHRLLLHQRRRRLLLRRRPPRRLRGRLRRRLLTSQERRRLRRSLLLLLK